ncbi:zinc finger protein Xfin-like [Oppia nitens]|uniref:zinc finger protein Xfin-like n=1 Tax=Oppia nitens TaxID=1686743 RepID=UPI0023DC161D|nr:zinc finger protein Xfin-like [Oppia nitens]
MDTKTLPLKTLSIRLTDIFADYSKQLASKSRENQLLKWCLNKSDLIRKLLEECNETLVAIIELCQLDENSNTKIVQLIGSVRQLENRIGREKQSLRTFREDNGRCLLAAVTTCDDKCIQTDNNFGDNNNNKDLVIEEKSEPIDVKCDTKEVLKKCDTNRLTDGLNELNGEDYEENNSIQSNSSVCDICPEDSQDVVNSDTNDDDDDDNDCSDTEWWTSKNRKRLMKSRRRTELINSPVKPLKTGDKYRSDTTVVVNNNNNKTADNDRVVTDKQIDTILENFVVDDNNNDSKYVCLRENCQFSCPLSDRDIFYEHYKQHDVVDEPNRPTGNRQRPYGCDECSSTFAKISDAVRHKREVHPQTLFVCNQPDCGVKLKTLRSLVRHKENVHRKLTMKTTATTTRIPANKTDDKLITDNSEDLKKTVDDRQNCRINVRNRRRTTTTTASINDYNNCDNNSQQSDDLVRDRDFFVDNLNDSNFENNDDEDDEDNSDFEWTSKNRRQRKSKRLRAQESVGETNDQQIDRILQHFIVNGGDDDDNKNKYVCPLESCQHSCPLGERDVFYEHYKKHNTSTFDPIRTDNPDQPFVCDECSLPFKTLADAVNHKRDVHPPALYVCNRPDCPVKLKTIRGFIDHMKTVHMKKNKKKMTTNKKKKKQTLNNRKKNMDIICELFLVDNNRYVCHRENCQFSCPIGDKDVFYKHHCQHNQTNKPIVMTTADDGNGKVVKHYACYVCAQVYTDRRLCSRHQQRCHPSSVFVCLLDNCRVRVKTLYHLKMHRDNLHRKLLNYQCDWPGCEHRAFTKSLIDNHKLVHSEVKKMSCDWPGCQFRCKVKYSMVAHMRRHTRERPYQCDWPGCTFSCTQQCALTVHKRRHTGEKPYECRDNGCGKRFASLSGLHIHRKQHITGRIGIRGRPKI